MTRGNPYVQTCPVCRGRKVPAFLLCETCNAAFVRVKAAPGESYQERLYRLADWAIRRAVRLERARAREAGCRMIAQMRAEPNKEK